MFKNHRKKKSRSKSRSQSVFSGSSKEVRFEEPPSPDNFAIKTSQYMGRYMVAAKDFEPGEIILKESPLVIGPCTNCKVQCLGCYRVLEESGEYFKCASCGWPLCSKNCSGINQPHGHTQIECSTLTKTKSSQYLDYHNFSKLSAQFQTITPLRCLLLKKYNPEIFKLLMEMEAHNSIRKDIPDIWENNQVCVVNRIRKDWGLNVYSEEEIHTICGILEVNAFEIGQNSVTLRGVYPTAYLMSHDCVPNTNHTDEEKGFTLTVRASTHIAQNHPITLSYAYTLQDTIKRREHLLSNKFFLCRCQRCSDPIELGTYMSALRCPKCSTGWVLHTDPLDSEASWACSNSNQESELKCPGYSVTAHSMKLLISRVTSELDALDSNDISGMEKFLDKYRNVLHPTHYLCLGIKLSLSQLYGKISGYSINDLTTEMLNRKRDICREILKVFDAIEPGFTRIRGITLYELHAPIMMLAMKSYQDSAITKSELRNALKEVVKCLEESYIILSYEPETSSEHIVCIAANEALGKIREWGKIIGKL